jgi:choline dehydrogenase
MPMTSREGSRIATVDAYLPLDAPHANLTIRPNAHVARIAFDGDNHAAGVELVTGEVIEASWVVLCAGVYGSPPILMRSGVGPAEHLKSVGIGVRVELPGVGANLADHPAVDIDCGYQGPGRTAPVLHTIATFHSSSASNAEAPDLMLWMPDPDRSTGGLASYEIGVVLMKPRSRGSVRLRSSDPAEPPHVELPSLTDPSDPERLAEGYLRGLEVANQPELRRLCAEAPSPEARARKAVRDVVHADHYSIPHVVGTCAMGPRPEDGAVVDASGRVHGTEALSVVDASIMPDVPSGFTHMPTIMIAERLSERIASQL